jgi:hypothetical protein
MQEVTPITSDWLAVYNHTYLFDGEKAVAYIKYGEKNPIYFKKGLKINRARRKFIELKTNPFTAVMMDEKRRWRVDSKSNVYVVSLAAQEWDCSCTGFKYHGKCKHVTGVKNKMGAV